MADLKTKVFYLDVDKIKAISAGVTKLSNVAVNDAVKKNMFDKLVTKVNQFGRTCVPNKTKVVNMKIFNMTKEIEPKTLTRRISCECRCGLDAKKCNLGQKWDNDECQCES